MSKFCSGLPIRLLAAICALVLLIAPLRPVALAEEPAPALALQGIGDIDEAPMAQPLANPSVSTEGEEDSRTPPRRSALAVPSPRCATVFPAARPGTTRATAFRARAPPLPV